MLVHVGSRVRCLVGAILVFAGTLAAASHPEPDSVYLQEIGRQVPSETAVTAVALHGGRVFAGTAGGLFEVGSGRWIPVGNVDGPVRRLVVAGDRVWALADSGLWAGDEAGWGRVTEQRVDDLVSFRGMTVAVGGRRLWAVRPGGLEALGSTEAPFVPARLVVQNETLWLAGAGRLTFFEHGRFGGRDQYDFPADLGWDWGELPSPRVTDAVGVDGRVILGTDRGLAEVRGMVVHAVTGAEGLPYEAVTCLAPGSDGDLWIGTARGVIRRTGDHYHYFAGRRWLPSDRVNAVAAAGRSVWVATDGGVAEIRLEPFTLARKADFYERHLEAWGQKRLGFVHKLEWDDSLGEFVREVSDNDGGYSGDYLAAQSYRFAVTGDPEARREATNTFHALCWLEAITGIPGLPARSIWVVGERGHKAGHGSGGYAAEWHPAADPRFEWKGDTSSDELCSQFYAVGVFLEHAARGEEIPVGRALLGRIADHLIRNGWRLIDRDGQPTRWGRWDPEYFRTDEGRFDRGLQAVELLSFMKTAAAVTGEPRFQEAYDGLVALGYPGYTLRQRQVFPPDSVLHFEDQLAFWSWWNLLRHETDPDLRSQYRRGFERSWEVVRIEHQPWFNFVYGALTGNGCEAPAAVRHLREWPLDLRVWSYQNSHRTDLRTPSGYRALKGGRQAISRRESEPIRLDAWTMKADGGAGGRDVVEPSAWLLAYWKGRHLGFIGAPEPAEAGSAGRDPVSVPPGGARPYEGPGRP